MALGFGRKSSPSDDIKKLSRAELLEMLIDQIREADRLRARNKRLTRELAECKENLERSASLQIIMNRLERIERIAAVHVGFTEEELDELAQMSGMFDEESEDEEWEETEPEAEDEAPGEDAAVGEEAAVEVEAAPAQEEAAAEETAPAEETASTETEAFAQEAADKAGESAQ